MAKRRLQITMDGGRFLVKKLDENVLLAGPWHAAMERVRQIGVAQIRNRAPFASGRLEGSVGSKLDAHPVPHYVILTAGAENKGYRYGFALDAGHGKRKGGTEYRFHYRGERKLTKGWFKGARAKITPLIAPLLQVAAKAVELEWAK